RRCMDGESVDPTTKPLSTKMELSELGMPTANQRMLPSVSTTTGVPTRDFMAKKSNPRSLRGAPATPIVGLSKVAFASVYGAVTKGTDIDCSEPSLNRREKTTWFAYPAYNPNTGMVAGPPAFR